MTIYQCVRLEEKLVLHFEISRTAIVAYEDGGSLKSSFNAFNDPSEAED